MGDIMFKKMDYVLAIYKEKSFTKAAEKLYISQPCLSAAIKKLEEDIGMPLFERGHDGIVPTLVGNEYIETALAINNLKKDFSAKINDIANLKSGNLILGGSNYVSSYILPRLVGEFSRAYPNIGISLTEAGSVELGKKIIAEEIDLVIDNFDGAKGSFEGLPLFEEKILLAVPGESPVNNGLEEYRLTPEQIYSNTVDYSKVKTVDIKHFAKESFILLKNGNDMYFQAQKIFKLCGFTPKVNFRLDQLITSYSLATSGNGVCFVSDTLFKYHQFKDDVFLYNIKGSGSRTLYVVKKKNRYKTRAMERFCEIAKDAVNKGK